MNKKLYKIAKRILGARLIYRFFCLCAKRILNGLIFISVRNYRLPKHITPEYLLSIPTVHTVGDSLLHFHYTRLSAEEQKRPVLCLTPDTFPSNIYVGFIFNKEEYIFYSEPLYNFMVRFLNRSYVNHIILETLKKRFKKLKPLIFYQKDYKKENDVIYLHMKDKNSAFANAYLHIRRVDNKTDAMNKYARLLIKWGGNPERFPGFSYKYQQDLKAKLGLGNKYVCLHIRLYPENGLYAYSPERETDPRGIAKVENYFPAIKFLINKGYQVVRMGNVDNRKLPDIHGYIDYANSGQQNLLNDLHLASGCKFFIVSKSGVDVFAVLFRKPILGLNYVCLNSIQGIPELRFYPKTIINHSGKQLTLSELLNHEIYYSQGAEIYNRNGLRTVDLTSDEILEAVQEMLELVENPAANWTDYTERQKIFRATVRPEHLDLFYTQGAPCDSYLRKFISDIDLVCR